MNTLILGDLVERVQALEDKDIALNDLPLASMRNALIENGPPIDGQLLLPGSISAPVLATTPSCHIYKSTQTVVASGASVFPAFDGEEFDTSNMHDLVTNPSRATAPIAGLWLVLFSAGLTTAVVDGRFQIGIEVNGGGTLLGRQNIPIGAFEGVGMTVLKLAVGDYVRGRYLNTGTAGLTVNADVATGDAQSLRLVWLGGVG